MPKNKPQLVVFCSLSAITPEYAEEFTRQTGTVVLSKDVLTDALFDGGNHHNSAAYQEMKPNFYKALVAQAEDFLKQGVNVALFGYFGDKLADPNHPYLQELITNPDYNVSIVYLHQSAARHRNVIEIEHAKDSREDDKRGDKYEPYRVDHIQRHLNNLSRFSDVLVVDAENPTKVVENVNKIANYVKQDKAISVQPDVMKIEATSGDAEAGADVFFKLLGSQNKKLVAGTEASVRSVILYCIALATAIGFGVVAEHYNRPSPRL